MQIVDNKLIVVRTRRPHLVTEAITKSKVIGRLPDGLHDVAVYFGLKEVQALTNLKIKGVPSTINRDYNWPGQYKPFAHQKETAAFLTLRKRAFCFNEQGTGKTAAVIWAADYLMKLGAIRRVLIICPLSIMKSAWQQDLFKFAVHRSCDIAYGKRDQRVKVIQAGAEFVVVNFDGLEIIKDEVANGGFDLIVVDEASAYKNIQTNRWKTLKSLLTPDMWLWMLTGTPAAQSPVDAFGLAKLINPDGIPKFFGQFRDKVMDKLGQFRWVPRKDADTTVHNALQPAIRFEKAQCLDLPDVTHVEREAPLTAQQEKYYKTLKQLMVMQAGGEETA